MGSKADSLGCGWWSQAQLLLRKVIKWSQLEILKPILTNTLIIPKRIQLNVSGFHQRLSWASSACFQACWWGLGPSLVVGEDAEDAEEDVRRGKSPLLMLFCSSVSLKILLAPIIEICGYHVCPHIQKVSAFQSQQICGQSVYILTMKCCDRSV